MRPPMLTAGTPLGAANAAFRNKNYAKAVASYAQLLGVDSALERFILFNASLARRRYRRSRQTESGPLAVIGAWAEHGQEVARAQARAQQLLPLCPVLLVTSAVGRPVAMLPEVAHLLPISDDSRIVDQLRDYVLSQPCDQVHLMSTSTPLVLLGMLYKLVWDAEILFEPALAPLEAEAAPAVLELSDLAGESWRALAAALATDLSSGGPGWSWSDRLLAVMSYWGAGFAAWAGGGTHRTIVHSQVHSGLVREPVRLEDEDPNLTLLRNSYLFDPQWYAARYDDVHGAGMDAAWHYLNFGAQEGRDPSPRFSTGFYRHMHQDVASANLNPLVHYLCFGKAEGRDIHVAGWVEPDFEYASRAATRLEAWREVNLPNSQRRSALTSALARIGVQSAAAPLVLVETDIHFMRAVSRADVISFDVFDTLIGRKVCRPADAFSIVERRLLCELGYAGPFASERIQAESEARNASIYEEVSLTEIYACLQRRLAVDSTLASRMREMEIEVERRLVCARPHGRRLFDIARASGKPVHLISDFYMDGTQVGELLERCGFQGYATLLVSSVERQTKHSGRLFDRFLAIHGYQSSRVLHVGDNPHSDGDMAVSRGLQPYLVQREFDRFSGSGELARIWGADFISDQQSPMASIMLAICARKLVDD